MVWARSTAHASCAADGTSGQHASRRSCPRCGAHQAVRVRDHGERQRGRRPTTCVANRDADAVPCRASGPKSRLRVPAPNGSLTVRRARVRRTSASAMPHRSAETAQ
ncbi:hypothetical protein FA09DRAFT_330196 [Tilletiopsis washingtonensis]|uniref:Uncharacterized protein n=1 Tax=Tilletiopsis washingtonensis TaxID=58919 RepID=A0A316Z9R6_9BASI|nr:hypothetical protein FA09DRAFT_330196 [Tilletiopsis washingtonensis]PWN98036.1 hypothetical protein FA09DRAFT_330196 [Tilletiopsis washingtonensis]